MKVTVVKKYTKDIYCDWTSYFTYFYTYTVKKSGTYKILLFTPFTIKLNNLDIFNSDTRIEGLYIHNELSEYIINLQENDIIEVNSEKHRSIVLLKN